MMRLTGLALFLAALLAMSSVALGARMGVLERPRAGPRGIVGTVWRDAQGQFATGLSAMPGLKDNAFVPYGKNYTGLIQFMGTEAYIQKDHTMVVFAADQNKNGATTFNFFDVHSGTMGAQQVDLPQLVSYVFVGLGIKVNYDPVKERTVVSGLLDFNPQHPHVIEHAYYQIGGGGKATPVQDLGFKLEDLVPKNFWQNGFLGVLGTKLSAFDPEEGVMWEVMARNSTATNNAEFIMVGVDVDNKKLHSQLTFPLGDCKFAGALTWNPATKDILMPTLNLDGEFILAQFDPKKKTCVTKQKWQPDMLPMAGLLTFNSEKKDTFSMLVNPNANPTAAGAAVEKQDTELTIVEEPATGRKVVVLPTHKHLLEASGLLTRVDGTETETEGPPPKSLPFAVVDYNYETNQITERSPQVCDQLKLNNCPWQLEWSS